MNWEAVSAIADAVGVIGVIVSLLYVAKQLRQSATYSRATTQMSLISQIGGVARWLSEDASRVDTIRRAAADFDSLNQDEQQLAAGVFTAWLAGLENAIYFREAGICPEAVYKLQENIALLVLNTPGGGQFWRHCGPMMGADLRTACDKLLAKGSTVPPLETVMPWFAAVQPIK